eukprot:1156131-Pelagomonas_calceolata.AAC.7
MIAHDKPHIPGMQQQHSVVLRLQANPSFTDVWAKLRRDHTHLIWGLGKITHAFPIDFCLLFLLVKGTHGASRCLEVPRARPCVSSFP